MPSTRSCAKASGLLLTLLAAGCVAEEPLVPFTPRVLVVDRPPEPVPLPLDEAAILTVSAGPELDYGAAVFEADDGSWRVVFERFSAGGTFSGELRVADSSDHETFGVSEPLSFGAEPLQVGPAALTDAMGDRWLYLMRGDTTAGSTRLVRASFDGADFGGAGLLALTDPFSGLFAWPHPVLAADGKVVLGYDHYQMEALIAEGDGESFSPGTSLGSGVQGRPGAFADGGLAFTWQEGFGGTMIAFVRVAADGATWSNPVVIQPASTNVHDAMPFTRTDGGVDVYYVYTGGLGTFALYRRPLWVDGTFGPEERITAEAFGGVTQPHPHRLSDGRILVTFTREVTNQTDYDVRCAVLTTDAPAQ